MKKVLMIGLAVVLMLGLVVSVVLGATEDFTTWTESDPNSRITKIATRITWTNLDRNEIAYVAKDKGADFFDGDFYHRFDIRLSDVNNGTYTYGWGVANALDGLWEIKKDSGSYLGIAFIGAISTDGISLIEVDSGTVYSQAWTGASEDTNYYLTVVRDEDIGTYGRLSCYIFSDSERNVLLYTLYLDLHTAKKNFRYIYGVSSVSSAGTPYLCSGYLENMELTGGGVPTALTQSATDIHFDSGIGWWVATINGKVTDDGGEPCTASFYYRIKDSGDWSWAGCSGTYMTDETFEATLYDLVEDETYEFYARVTNGSGYDDGATLEFTIESNPEVPSMITLMYPMDKDSDNFKVEVYGEVGYDGESLVDAWFEYREEDIPPWVVVYATSLIEKGGFELPDPLGEWTITGAGATQELSTTQVKEGTYSLKITRNGVNARSYQNLAEWERFKGVEVTMGAWVWASVANRARIQIDDGVTSADSSFHTGSSQFEWLEVTTTISPVATRIRRFLSIYDGDTIAYFDGVRFLRGDSIDNGYAYATLSEGGTGGVFHGWITGLAIDTWYEFRAIGENDTGIGYGGIGRFTLYEDIEIPVIETLEATAITDTSARVWGKTVDDGGMKCWSWFQYRRVGVSGWTDTPYVGQTETDVVWSYSLENLTPEESYEYRACAFNEAGTGYGAIKALGMLESVRTPDIKTGRKEYVDDATIRVWCEVVHDGGSPCQVWIQWRVLGDDEWTETERVHSVETGYEISRLIQDLKYEWWYEYRGLGENDIGIGYGGIESFCIKVEDEGEIVVPINPFEAVDRLLARFGLNNEGGHWLLMLLLMGGAFAIFYRLSRILRVVFPLVLFAIFMAIGWISIWIVVLLALGAGVTIFMLLRKQVAGGG